MKSKFKIEAAIRAVLTAKTDNFVELVKLARLAPESEFRNTDLSGCDFSGCDLTEFDFSGSNLEGANLKGATINGAPLHNGAEAPQVTAFVSYATADARSESALVSPLIREVRNAVNSRLRSYRFALLNEQVSSAREKISLQGSLDVGILIVLLSPAWILSAQCKDEYLSFIERYGDLGKDRIVPIKIARLGEYVERLDERQVRLWAELNANPNCVWLPIEFTQATRIQKKKIVVSITERLARLIESPEKKLLVFTEQDQITKSVRRGEAKRILIIDDKLSRSVFAGILRSRGYSVVSTGDGLEAFRAARTVLPDLILTEILLPEVSGLELAKWVKEDSELCNIPILAVTGFGLKGDEEKIRNGGCDIYIEKPARIETLLQAVKRFVAS